LLAGFQVAQALYVVAKLNVATALRDGPRPVRELAASTGAVPAALARLLRSLAGLGVFTEAEPGVYALTPLGATLASDTPGSVRDLALTWMETHYAPFGRLLDGVMSGAPAASLYYGKPFFEWLSSDAEQVQRFTGAMANLTDAIRLHAMSDYRLPRGGRVADVGGADGSLLCALLNDDPEPRRGVVLDLPHVVPAAREHIESLGLEQRIEAIGGDFFAQVPPADVYLVSMILHDWDDDACLRLLTSIGRSASRGTRLVALEFVVPHGDGPHMSKMIDLTMLGMLTGHERSALEFEGLLEAAGFTLDRIVETQTPLSILEATYQAGSSMPADSVQAIRS
jgi:O-methyltransferase domain/Dimerisation domain